MYFPIKAGHKMGARTKSLWVGTTSFPGLLRDYTGLPTSSSTSQPSHPNWIDVHKDHFRLWTKASIWSMIRSRPVYALKECIFGYSIIQYCWWLYGIWTPHGATSNMGPHCLRFYAPVPFLSFSFLIGSMSESQSVTQRLMFSRSWAYLRNIFGIFLGCLGHILGISWACLGWSWSWAYLRNILYIFWGYLWYIFGISWA